jgi:hypothetical protein
MRNQSPEGDTVAHSFGSSGIALMRSCWLRHRQVPSTGPSCFPAKLTFTPGDGSRPSQVSRITAQRAISKIVAEAPHKAIQALIEHIMVSLSSVAQRLR